jgi:hypothetical protein
MGLRARSGPVDHLAFDAADHEAIVARLDAAGVPRSRTSARRRYPPALRRRPDGVRIELNVR